MNTLISRLGVLLAVSAWLVLAASTPAMAKCNNDGTCGRGENANNCPSDCGGGSDPETDCTDGVDNDSDGATDCNDSDCSADPACSSTFTATATIIQTFEDGCVRTDTYNLSGCTPSDIQSECSVDSWNGATLVACDPIDQNQIEDPLLSNDVQTGLWSEAFDPPWDIDPNTEVTVFKIREIEQNGFFYGFLGLNTDQYGNGHKPNNMWANGCDSMGGPSLPLQDTIHLICPGTPTSNLNLRKGGGTLAQRVFSDPPPPPPIGLEVLVTRLP